MLSVSKIRRCVEKLRGRQKAFELLQGGDPPGRDLVSQGGNIPAKDLVSQGEGPPNKDLVPRVAVSTYENKGTYTGDYDGISESSMFSEREGPRKSKRLKKVPTKQQRIVCDVSYWGPTRQIEEAKLVALLRRTFEEEANSELKLINQLNGSFNVAYMMESSLGRKFCVRVPACGFPDRWNERDAELLRATALGMRFIKKNSELPIPDVLAYNDHMDNEIHAPFTIMSFLEGQSVALLWNDKSIERDLLEARRQKVLYSLANIMSTLSTTTFARAGTLWFPEEHGTPVVGDSYRLDKDNIFTVQRNFITFPPRESLTDLLHGGREKRFKEDGFPWKYRSAIDTAIYVLWSLMIEAFLLSGGKATVGEPEFVLMQSDFNPQNILADESGNVTGIIDWDCLESIPRQIGWCSLPHWLETDWYPDYSWPPDAGIENATRPDQYDRYREDYTEYLRAASGGEGDWIFTSRTHIYQALFDSVDSFEKVKCFVHNVLTDILPRVIRNRKYLLDDIGEDGFRLGEREWFEARLIRYFAPGAEPVSKH